jgi:hypothetical protein
VLAFTGKSFYFDGMNKIIYGLLILGSMAPAALFGQDETVYFDIHAPKPRPEKSLYTTIGYLDSRQDTSRIGVLKVRNNGRWIRIALRTPVLPQLTNVLNAYTGDGAGNGELLFQLKRFSFAEYARARYCYFSAVLYARNGDRYARLLGVDTAILLATASVDNELNHAGNGLLANFIAEGILLAPTDPTTYSMDDIRYIDSLDKRKIPVYSATTYTEGLYSNYAAFMAQRPDLRGEVRTKKNGGISSLDIHDPKWRHETKSHIYAVVYKGVPYVVTHFGYYPLQKKGDDFYFTGDLSLAPTNGEQVAADIALGVIVGSAIAGDKATYEVLIDYQNGQFIHQKVLAMK